MSPKILLVVSIVFLLTGCEQPTWDAFVYPDRNDLFNYNSIGEFKSLEECREASKKELERIHAQEPRGLFQCGKSCISASGLHTVTACKEIVR